MSFLFASSHLPEVKRPADEDDDVQPMQRSGMVRAFSHLPQPVVAAPAWPRPSGQAPAPASRPAWAAAPESPSGHEPSDGHDAEPDDDADDDHGSSASASTGAHEPDDGRPWYQPRITAADLQPEGGGHDDPAKDNIGPMPRLSGGAGSFSHPPVHGEDDAVNEHADAGSHVDFEPPETAGSDTHGTLGPVSPRGAAPPTGRSLFLTPRPMPPGYARQQTRTYGSAPARPKSLADTSGSMFQQVAAKTGAQQQYAQLSQSSPPARPASAKPPPPPTPAAQGRGPTPPAQRGAAAPQNAGAVAAPQGGGSLARYRQQRQALLDSKNSASKETQTKIASITRNMESIELAAHLINHTKQGKEAAIDPESIDENSDEFKNRARTAISRLHGGSAPWMDKLAENFGEREGPKGGPANPRLVKALGIDPTAAAWCGSALGKAMGKAGIKPPDAASWAGNWRKWGMHNGPRAGGPHVGDVYHIKYPDDTGHVTSVVGVSKDGSQVFCLGGNQNDGVNIAAYPIGQFTDPQKPDTGNYKGATIVYKKPLGQKNNTPAPTFNYNADPSSFNTLAHLTR